MLYLDSPGVSLDSKTKLGWLQPKKGETTQIQQDITTLVAPQELVSTMRATQHNVQLDTHVMYELQQVSWKRIDTHTLLQQDTSIL